MENYFGKQIFDEKFQDSLILTWQVQIRAAAITETNFIVGRESGPTVQPYLQHNTFIPTLEEDVSSQGTHLYSENFILKTHKKDLTDIK